MNPCFTQGCKKYELKQMKTCIKFNYLSNCRTKEDGGIELTRVGEEKKEIDRIYTNYIGNHRGAIRVGYRPVTMKVPTFDFKRKSLKLSAKRSKKKCKKKSKRVSVKRSKKKSKKKSRRVSLKRSK